MTKLFVVSMNGLNWYVTNRATCVNATAEEVTLENYNEVSDVTCFTLQEPVSSKEELEVEVLDRLACDKIWDEIYSKISLQLDSNQADTICRKIEQQRAFRENDVLANFESIEIEENSLHIYATNGTGITVGLGNRLGDIIG